MAWCTELTEKYIEKQDLFTTLEKEYHYVMPTPPVIRINQMLNLLTALLMKFVQKQETVDKKTFEMLYVYCLSWAIAGLFETEDREKFHKYLESRHAPLPPCKSTSGGDKETVFDYFIDENTKAWKIWEAEVWNAPKRIQFSQLLIPTSDSTRAEYIIDKIAKLPLMRHDRRKEPGHLNTLLVGGPGTAKTSIVMMYTSKFDNEVMMFKRINFSSATTPFNF